METIKFEVVLREASAVPGVKIDRNDFLRKELKKYCDEKLVVEAVETSPREAGISSKVIDEIAKSCINYETNKVTAISVVAGLPGGPVAIGTIPLDLAQYFAHILRIVQKLAYLYGWEDLFGDDGKMDDETSNLMTIFVGVAMGVSGAAGALTKIASKASEKTSKTLASKALTKGTIYPVIKKIAQKLGYKMTKEVFARNVAKVVPIVGGGVSGGLTYVTYRPMAMRLYKYLQDLDNRARE